jgi:hypothetical protein
MFPGQTLDAVLSTVPSQFSRTEQQVVLTIVGPPPFALYPGSTSGVEILEATPAELEALRRAGFDFPLSNPQQQNSTPDRGDKPSDAKKKWWQFWK